VVWQYWTEPEFILQWNHASDDWHTTDAENDLCKGGDFMYRMAAKDGSFSFDLTGVYDEVKPNERIAYTLGDGRKVSVQMISNDESTQVIEIFEAESMNPIEMQEAGWQAILNNFKNFTESN